MQIIFAQGLVCFAPAWLLLLNDSTLEQDVNTRTELRAVVDIMVWKIDCTVHLF